MSLRKNFDLSAYLVIGPENTLDRPVRTIVAQAVRAGFSFIQIRSKTASARELIELLREAADEIALQNKSDQVALVINDRLDVALAAREQGVKVDGIHVGQSDIPVAVCRKYLGPDAIIGLSARTYELIEYVKSFDPAEIDYFGAGPLQATATKPDCGLDPEGNFQTRSYAELEELAELSSIPVVVGGGVKTEHLADLKQTGVAGFFVVSAIAEATDPEAAAAEMLATWKGAKA